MLSSERFLVVYIALSLSLLARWLAPSFLLVTATLESLLLFPAPDALVLLFPSLVEPSANEPGAVAEEEGDHGAERHVSYLRVRPQGNAHQRKERCAEKGRHVQPIDAALFRLGLRDNVPVLFSVLRHLDLSDLRMPIGLV